MCRNKELMCIFKDLGLAEQLGSGMSVILKAYNKIVLDIVKGHTLLRRKKYRK